MSWSLWFTTLAACLAISLTPGPGALASTNAALAHGWAASLRLILGLQAALLLEVLLVAVGAGSLLAASPTAFKLATWCGAAYLAWLGWQLLRAAQSGAPAAAGAQAVPASDEAARPGEIHRALFQRGLLVNLSNPKAIIFIAALVPQLVVPEAPQAPQYALITLTMCVTDIVVMAGYARLASQLGAWLHAPAIVRWRDRLFGLLFIVLAIALPFGRTL